MIPFALCAIVLVAFVSEASLGFGATVITVTLGAHLYPLDLLLPAFVPLNLVVSIYLVVSGRRTIDRSLLGRRVLPWIGLGLVAGLLVFRLQSVRGLQLGFALFVVSLALLELARLIRHGQRPAAPLPPAVGPVLLVAGGFIHGLFASGGPMVVYFLGRTLTGKAAFRSTLAALWLILNSVLLVNYASLGMLNARSAQLSAWLLPSLAGGLVAGEWLHGRLRDDLFRVLVYALLLLAGGALAMRTLAKMT